MPFRLFLFLVISTGANFVAGRRISNCHTKLANHNAIATCRPHVFKSVYILQVVSLTGSQILVSTTHSAKAKTTDRKIPPHKLTQDSQSAS